MNEATMRVPFVSARPESNAESRRPEWSLVKGYDSGECALDLTIALRIDLKATEALLKSLREVSDPRSKKYGKFLALNTITEIVDNDGSETRRYERVETWLKSAQDISDACSVEPSRTKIGDIVSVSLSIAQAEHLFNTTVGCFDHSSASYNHYASTSDPSIPSYLKDDIEFVTGLDLPRVRSSRRRRRRAAVSSSPSTAENAARDRSNVPGVENAESRNAKKFDVRDEDRDDTSHSASKAADGRRNGSTLSVDDFLRIDVVENRDRAFQVHLSLNVSEAKRVRSTICKDRGVLSSDGIEQTNASPWRCPDGTPMVVTFEGIATPTRGLRDDYLEPVHLNAPFTEHVCSAGVSATDASNVLVCVVRFGPSLLLANYVPTHLVVRAKFADGNATDYVGYDGYTFPTQMMTVNNVRKLYSVPKDYRTGMPHMNTQAVVNFLNISISRKDTRLFQTVMAYEEQPPVRFRGAPNDPNELNDIEGSIDIQWIQGIGQGVPTTYWLTSGGNYGHEPFLDWLIAVQNVEDPELVQSLSYGENEDAYTIEYERRCNLGFVILGLRGVTVVVASGDTGIQGSAQLNGAEPRCKPFVPTFPASSPYVTTVGGTQFSNHILPLCDLEEVYSVGTNASMPFSCPDDDIGEIVCSTDTGAMITSGGGVSDRFARPWYQDKLIPPYLNSSAATFGGGLFNMSGRGYPDVSAVGQNVPAAWQGRVQMAGGTSSSAPIVAGLFSLMNGERLASGLPPLGFVNPLLYLIGEEYPAALNDVVAGNISGGNRLLPQYATCEKGFVATSGWDAATGLGSLNFAAILEHVVPSPRSQNSPFAQDDDGDDGGSDDYKIDATLVAIIALSSVASSLLTVLLGYFVRVIASHLLGSRNTRRPRADSDLAASRYIRVDSDSDRPEAAVAGM